MAETKKMITLVSKDNESFEVEESVAKLSKTIANLIEEGVDIDKGIPIPIVHSAALARVIEYCNKHAEEANKKKDNADEKGDSADWEKEFLGTDFDDLCAILTAANYLNIKCLLDRGTRIVADLIKDSSVEVVREIFKIQNDFTPEEEAEIRKEHAFAFEPKQQN